MKISISWKIHLNCRGKLCFFKNRGSGYIVLAQLEGYFQLLDLADWDYAINISVDDFPLMSTGAIHQKLQVIIMNAYRIGRPRKELHSILATRL